MSSLFAPSHPVELISGWNPDVHVNITTAGSLGLSHLDLIDIGWDDIHDAIQRELSLLAHSVAAQAPEIEWRSGRTTGRSFPLFSYRTFRVPANPDFDPVVAGVTFSDRDSQFLISGDISGEESGQILYSDEHCERIVERPTLSTLLHEGLLIARKLTARSEIVVESLRTRQEPAAPEHLDSPAETR